MRDYIRHLKVNRIQTRQLVKDAYEIRKMNHGLKGWISERIFNLLIKWGYLQPHFDEVATEVWDFTPSKRKLLTDKILEAVQDLQYRGIDVNALDKYAIVMGESTFFTALKESDYHMGPFFVNPVAFRTESIYHQDPYYGRRAFGWDVHIVPGLEGFAFIPKVIIEKR